MSGHYTVFGARGLVGSTVAAQLEAQGRHVRRVVRGEWPAAGEDLGRVVFTIGMTADFRNRLVETFDLQILRLHEALTRYKFESFTYLSSARVYAGAASTQEETPLLVRPSETDHVYNISKLAGESLCFAFPDPNIRVVRLSNVYGAQDVSNLFLTAVMREAVATGKVSIGQSPLSAKDYITVDDAAAAIVAISQRGRQRLYNVAFGRNVTHREIADIMVSARYLVDFRQGGALADFPSMSMDRFDAEFAMAREEPQAGILRTLRALEEKKKQA